MRRQTQAAFAVTYVGSVAVILSGLFVPFVQQGCPGNAPCILIKLFLPRTCLAQGQDGLILLALVSAALLVGLVSVAVRLATPLLAAQPILPLATLALVLLDATDAWGRVVQLPRGRFDLLLSFAPGFYLAVIGCGVAFLTALLMLALGTGQFPSSRLPAARAAA